MMSEIAVVGAGLLGRTLAFELLKKNYSVTLFDRDSSRGERSCAFAGAGMLAPYCELDVCDSLVLSFGANAVSQWSSIIDSLAQPVFLQSEGTLVVAHGADSLMLDDFHTTLKRKSVKSAEQVVWLNGAELDLVEPSLGARFDRALLAKGEGQIDNRQLLEALELELQKRGCKWFTNVEVLSTAPFVVATEAKKYRFDLVIDCRGLGAKEQFSDLRGVRGEIIAVHSEDVSLRRPVRVLHPRYAIYVVPRQNQNFIIGATSIESEDYSDITVLSTLELLSAAFSLDPAFARATIYENRVNCRPALPDNLPSIKVDSGLIAANGLYRHGFLLTPTVVAAIIDLVEEKALSPQFENLIRYLPDAAGSEFSSEGILCT